VLTRESLPPKSRKRTLEQLEKSFIVNLFLHTTLYSHGHAVHSPNAVSTSDTISRYNFNNVVTIIPHLNTTIVPQCISDTQARHNLRIFQRNKINGTASAARYQLVVCQPLIAVHLTLVPVTACIAIKKHK
jgi:hypothetical protein